MQARGRCHHERRELEELGNLLRVDALHLVERLHLGMIDRGALVFDDDHGQSVDPEHHVHAPGVAIHEAQLLGEVEGVPVQVLEVDRVRLRSRCSLRVVDCPTSSQPLEIALVAGHVGRQHAQATDHLVDVGRVSRPGLSARSWPRRTSGKKGWLSSPPRACSTSSGGR